MCSGNAKIMTTPKRRKIYLVDDDVFSLSLTEQHIRNLGYADVTVFQNGTDCLNRLEEHPDIVFLDHHMDVLSGFEVLKKIKRFNPNIYVVILSGQDNLKTAVDSLKFGAFDYLIKGDQDMEKITEVLKRIEEVQKLLKKNSNPFLKLLMGLM